MNTQIIQKYKTYIPKSVQKDRYHKDYYWVKSDKYNELSYRVILSDTEIYCACEFFKYKKEICKHLYKVMAIDGGRTV